MKQLPVNMDLCEAALEDAATLLGYVPPHIIASSDNVFEAERLAIKYCWSWAVDAELSGDQWKIRVNGQTMFSLGA